MYHISKDKRAQTSANLIVEGFKKCLKEKEFEKITITDIQRTSTVGRATFYRLFDKMEDVVAYMCDRVFESLINELEPQDDMWALITVVLEEWMKQEELIKIIVENHREDILFECHKKYYRELIKVLPFLSQNQSVYEISILSSLLSSTLMTWYSNGKRESAEDIVSSIKVLLLKLSYID